MKAQALSFDRGLQIGFVFGAAFMSLILAAIWPTSAHAETNAQKVFGRWEAKRVDQIMDPVPEWEQPRTLPGAVSKQDLYKPDPDACPIIEAGKVVGFRFNCPQSDRRAVRGGPQVPSASDS